jgi:hypothetical protein
MLRPSVSSAAKRDRRKRSERAILPIIGIPFAGRRRPRGFMPRVDVSLQGRVNAERFTASGKLAEDAHLDSTKALPSYLKKS